MSPSKMQFWYSNNCLHFQMCAIPLDIKNSYFWMLFEFNRNIEMIKNYFLSQYYTKSSYRSSSEIFKLLFEGEEEYDPIRKGLTVTYSILCLLLLLVSHKKLNILGNLIKNFLKTMVKFWVRRTHIIRYWRWSI